ncbi:cytochrome P450 [Actinomadura scrupuli]|uniref:cytochrome P450 n=1 Tax=Actinomadura scrupuli TaxID=559629 RepID=UPI003D973F0B
MANTVEELLRYLSIVQDLIVRVVREDVTVGDQLIRAGEYLFMNLPVANRDPAHFEQPDVLDIDRRRRGNVAFGYGIHQCVGQALARAELEVAYGTMLRRDCHHYVSRSRSGTSISGTTWARSECTGYRSHGEPL